jgi:hypothetical protein
MLLTRFRLASPKQPNRTTYRAPDEALSPPATKCMSVVVVRAGVRRSLSNLVHLLTQSLAFPGPTPPPRLPRVSMDVPTRPGNSTYTIPQSTSLPVARRLYARPFPATNL